MQRATKIVATLGPASSDYSVLHNLIASGVDVVRLNFSHGTAADHCARIDTLRQAMQAVLDMDLVMRAAIGNAAFFRVDGALYEMAPPPKPASSAATSCASLPAARCWSRLDRNSCSMRIAS